MAHGLALRVLNDGVTFAGAHEMLRPEIILGFHSLCLVKPVDDDDWYMGSLYDDGSVDCWAAYDDLYERSE